MNSGPLLFLGVLFTLCTSFWGLVLVPQLQIGRLPQVIAEATGRYYPTERGGDAARGAEVYRSLGCVECHTQQVRQRGVTYGATLTGLGENTNAVLAAFVKLGLAANPAEALAKTAVLPLSLVEGMGPDRPTYLVETLKDAGGKAQLTFRYHGTDNARGWGTRASVAQDYVGEPLVQLGSLRVGPDLANVGARIPDAATHLKHLYDPRGTTPGSMMPAYRFLFERRPLVAGQKAATEAIASGSDYEIVANGDARALAGYLLSLRQDLPLFEAPISAPPQAAPAGSAAPAAPAVPAPKP